MYAGNFYSNFPLDSVAINPFNGPNSIEWVVNNFINIDPESDRVVRGGDYGVEDPELLRVANRSYYPPRTTAINFGFRCVKPVSP